MQYDDNNDQLSCHSIYAIFPCSKITEDPIISRDDCREIAINDGRPETTVQESAIVPAKLLLAVLHSFYQVLKR